MDEVFFLFLIARLFLTLEREREEYVLQKSFSLFHYARSSCRFIGSLIVHYDEEARVRYSIRGKIKTNCQSFCVNSRQETRWLWKRVLTSFSHVSSSSSPLLSPPDRSLILYHLNRVRRCTTFAKLLPRVARPFINNSCFSLYGVNGGRFFIRAAC